VKILNVNHTINPVNGGGTAERTFEFSKHLIKAGYDCDVVTLDAGEPRRTLDGGRMIKVPTLSKRFNAPLFFLYKINAAVKTSDIIHMMGHWSVINAFAFIAAQLHRKPYVVCPAGGLPVFGRSRILKKFYNFLIGNRIVKHANLGIAITETEVTQFEAYGISREKIIVLPNAVEAPTAPLLSHTEFRKKYHLSIRPFILFLGRLNLIKGPDLLLRAFIELADEFPDYDLVFAGPDGGMLSELQSVATGSSHRDHIHCIGFVDGVDKYSAYRAAEFLVIPSRQEAMSLVVLEAGIVGTPSLFTTECGLDDFAKQELGWIATPTVAGLNSEMRKILANRHSVEAKREPLMAFVKSNFSWDIIIRRATAAFRQVVAIHEQ
jgi:glycosyltransferase involved in cell wall biosynthesis